MGPEAKPSENLFLLIGRFPVFFFNSCMPAPGRPGGLIPLIPSSRTQIVIKVLQTFFAFFFKCPEIGSVNSDYRSFP